jgi:hypothetical protein
LARVNELSKPSSTAALVVCSLTKILPKNFDINYLDKLVKAYNVDGTENKWGTINAYVNLEFSLGKRKFKEHFYVTGLGKQRIILGFPWLHKHNPIIDWKKGEITFKPFRIDWRCLMEKGKRI